MNIHIEQKDLATAIALEGRLDGVTMQQLEQQLVQLLEQGYKHFLFHLERLDYISSAGLRVMLFAIKRTKVIQGSVVLCAMQSNVKDIFDLSGFSSIFTICNSEEEAWAFLQANA
ncbi:STAS domain-containing protein [Paenibacillus endoradicis]|uniref:STAS domain-containing protein n=1 Tax=Paenibacillus endoradicis TaxID=2972487 RepID=UPI0021592FD0|nr:STAS domain-containing protein [Paenibacillus endoradicis]MCR8657456.1 STAS domain-containing protein [Paenibacillus endoradicis]